MNIATVKNSPDLKSPAQSVRGYAQRIRGKDNHEFTRMLTGIADAFDRSHDAFSTLTQNVKDRVTHANSALAPGQLLIGNGLADVTVGNLSGDATTSGATAVTVTGIQGTPVKSGTPSDGQTLRYVSANSDIEWGDATVAYSADASASLTLTSSFQDIPGATLTAVKAGTYAVDFTASVSLIENDGGITVQLVVGGVANSKAPIWDVRVATGSLAAGTLSYTYLISGIAANTVIKLQAKKASGTNSSLVTQPTSIRAIRVGS